MPGNIENLKPFKKGDPRTIELASKGGKATQKARRMKKRDSLQNLATMLATAPVKDKKLAKKLTEMFPTDTEIVGNAAVVAGLFQQAVLGNVKAFEKWDNILLDADKNLGKQFFLPATVMGKAFVDINRHIDPNITYVFKGGRGGLKSSYISLKIVELIKNYPDMHACIVRKVSNTLKDSVYAQIKWAINELDLTDEFEYTKNPLEIKYKATGQTIYFRGADDPTKLKSIKPEFGYLGILWIEEADQMAGMEEVRNIKQSVLRGGDIAFDFMSYNPPKTMDAWVNRAELVEDKNRVIHSSCYLDAPPEWLGQKFIQDAEHLKETNPDAYEHEYLGKANGTGGQVFEHLQIREITDEEIASFDRIYQGVDFGWYPDLYAFTRSAYVSATNTLYIFDEFTGNKLSNKRTAKWILDKGYDDYKITCDSAEPKSIDDYKDLGLPAQGARKGPGSIDYSFKWLCTVNIVIDPIRCPNAAKEFPNYEYERDKEGNVISGYPDKDNHSIDSVRYGTEEIWAKRGNNA